jgi:C4-dicarboxylate-specific signal transduction histidine kinase
MNNDIKMNTIYIADDSQLFRTILERSLSKSGFKVTCFSSGKDIYNAIRSAPDPVVALLDWMMPDMTGLEICSLLSEDPPPSVYYTIILTSRNDKRDIVEALNSGADDFIAKPFDFSELSARINSGFRLLNFKTQLIESNSRMLDYTKQMESLAASRAEQLIHADRLSTIGILSAGIAHEINNPTSFISINIQTLEENFKKISDALKPDASGEQHLDAQQFIANLPEIIDEMKRGVSRIQKIVNSLKSYSYNATNKYTWFNLNDCIESALHLCTNRLKYTINVKKDITPVPDIFGIKNQIEQVLVNLFTNAADSIEECNTAGMIEITMFCKYSVITLSIRDNGCGFNSKHADKLFTPFFTTKPIGKGTGLGLSISRNIIFDHHGSISAENHPDGGAVFTITFPVNEKGST